MGLFFLGYQRKNILAMVEEVAKGVENLGFGDAQRLGDLQDSLAAPVQCDHMTDGHAQPIDHRLTAAYTLKPDDVRMLSLDHLSHAFASAEKGVSTFDSVTDDWESNQADVGTEA
jgi:hypothetical protein